MSNDNRWQRAVSVFLTVIVTAGAVLSAVFFFVTVRDVVAQMDLPFAEQETGISQPERKPDPQGGEPQPVEAEPEPEPLGERINVLLLGIDQRPGEKGPFRTDTMILVSLDPVTNTASMLSIPRDLWTTIPGYGEGRINTAHFTGDNLKYPGGGPALAKKTVWYALGVPVDNYVRVNFAGFEQLVDAIGGIDVEVTEDIYDATYPTSDYGTMVLRIPAGNHHMDGDLALKYARTRHGSSDFQRMERQQQVIRAAFSKVLSLNIPLSRIPTILQVLGSSVQTDLTPSQIITLVDAARKIDPGDLRSGVIDHTMTTTVTTAGGAMVEVPNWPKVRQLVEDLFPTTVAVEPSPTPVPAEAFIEEGARVAVYNGTATESLAEETAQMLRDKGFTIAGFSTADRLDHEHTLLIVYRDRPLTLIALARELGVAPEQIIPQENGSQQIDIAIVLGSDYLEQRSNR
ncbi:MAG: LCP family protein [Anaerolineae bacterium]|jgi:LCP family protein required for cell wall assembly